MLHLQVECWLASSLESVPYLLVCLLNVPGCPVQVTPRDYLETALQPLAGSGRAVEAKNQVRPASCITI